MTRMMQEILEQPEALERTFLAERSHAEEFRRLARRRRFRLIVLVARGTSDNAALFGRYLLELTTRIPVSLAAPSIHTLYHAPLNLRHALVIGISQSGEGTDINLVLRAARESGAHTIGITNEAGSAITRIVHDVFLVRAGRQRSVAATKTFTGQLLVLYLLAAALARPAAFADIARIPDLAASALRLRQEAGEVARSFRRMRHCVVVARGLNYANAYELALKLMETCYVVAERFSSADFLHGPIALIERKFPVILFLPDGPAHAGLSRLARRLNHMGARTLVISSQGVRLPAQAAALRIPAEIPEILTPIPYIIPGQLFAASLAELLGRNPDRPRALRLVTRSV